MSDYVMQPKNKKTFQDIYYEHLNRILEITKSEFTGGRDKPIVSGGMTYTEYVTDKREEYCQVVEAMLCLLHGYFDKDMKEKYKEYQEKLNEAFKKHYDEETLMEKSNKDYQIYSRKRLKLTYEIFKQTCDFAIRKNHFQARSYIETDENFDDEETEIPEEE